MSLSLEKITHSPHPEKIYLGDVTNTERNFPLPQPRDRFTSGMSLTLEEISHSLTQRRFTSGMSLTLEEISHSPTQRQIYLGDVTNTGRNFPLPYPETDLPRGCHCHWKKLPTPPTQRRFTSGMSLTLKEITHSPHPETDLPRGYVTNTGKNFTLPQPRDRFTSGICH